MVVYVSLLRGINVGGHKSVPMAELKKLLESLGVSSVSTYIQSGNAVFESDLKASAIRTRLESALLSHFKFEVKVIVLSSSKLSSILSANPFSPLKLKEGERVYLTLLSSCPSPPLAEKLKSLEGNGDELAVVGDVVYIRCMGGYGRSAFSNNAVEKILKVSATTRNLDTMRKLAEMASARSPA